MSSEIESMNGKKLLSKWLLYLVIFLHVLFLSLSVLLFNDWYHHDFGHSSNTYKNILWIYWGITIIILLNIIYDNISKNLSYINIISLFLLVLWDNVFYYESEIPGSFFTAFLLSIPSIINLIIIRKYGESFKIEEKMIGPKTEDEQTERRKKLVLIVGGLLLIVSMYSEIGMLIFEAIIVSGYGILNAFETFKTEPEEVRSEVEPVAEQVKSKELEPSFKSSSVLPENIATEHGIEKIRIAAPKKEPYIKKPAPSIVKPKSVSTYSGNTINVKSAFGYKGATIIYKVKVENNTNEPISDIKVYPYVPDVFMLREKEKTISLIEPKSSQTATFEIRPTGECGDCNVSGRVNYYDMVSKKHLDIELEPKSLSIICPILRRREIREDEWREVVSNFIKAEETTTDIPIESESLFGMVSEILKDLNLFELAPVITKSQQLFRGTARFYGEGVKGLRYAAQMEVVGGARKSKLILKAWAEKEEALTGFYHGILDEIEKRVDVKEYIDDSIVQYHVHIGDKIGALIKDSVIQRSTIGASAMKCPNCGREVEANEKFCLECGAKL